MCIIIPIYYFSLCVGYTEDKESFENAPYISDEVAEERLLLPRRFFQSRLKGSIEKSLSAYNLIMIYRHALYDE